METAARYAAGLDYQPWNLRCLFHPLVLTWPFLRAGILLGASDPALLSWLGAISTVLFSTLGVFLVYRLAVAWQWPEETALVAAFLYAIHFLSLGYGSTLFPRPMKYQEIPWLLDLEQGIKLAKEEKRPVLMWTSGDDPLERC